MTKFKLNQGFITQRIKDKTTIFSGEQSILYTLNEVAAYIFQGLKLGWDKKKIVGDLAKKYEISEKQAEKDVESFAKELLKKKILTSS